MPVKLTKAHGSVCAPAHGGGRSRRVRPMNREPAAHGLLSPPAAHATMPPLRTHLKA